MDGNSRNEETKEMLIDNRDKFPMFVEEEREETKLYDPIYGVKCQGKECKRYSVDGIYFEFKPITCPALTKVSYLGRVSRNEFDRGFCEICKPSEINTISKTIVCMEEDRRRRIEEEKRKKTWCEAVWAQNDYPHLTEGCEPRKRNPIWTGDDPDQLGVFIRNLKIENVNEEAQTISLHFGLNVVWIDKKLCAEVKELKKLKKQKWFIQMTKDEYKKTFDSFYGTALEAMNIEDNPAMTERFQNALPNIMIWNGSTEDGYEVREEVISFNKSHIGPDTVYWRRIMRMKLRCEYTSKGFPFGYETFKMSIRLMSRTNQHLVLLRTKLWRDMHKRQSSKEILVDHTFAYLHPDNKGLKDWKVCSVHGNEDKFHSEYDNNDLTFRLPVRVTDGKNTQSRYEALLILKRKPTYVLWNIWIYFTVTTFLSLLTYKIDPVDDLPDRLAITVGIIFVQMGLKWDSSRKTARVSHITGLDMHIFLSIALVVVQAFAQVISILICNGRDNVTRRHDFYLFWISLVSVFILNMWTFFLAKNRQKWTRMTLEEKLKNFTGFSRCPLTHYSNGVPTEYPKEAIGSTIQLSGRQSDDPFQSTTRAVNEKASQVEAQKKASEEALDRKPQSESVILCQLGSSIAVTREK